MPKRINIDKLEELYNVIQAIEAEDDSLRKVLRAMSGENDFFGSDNVYKLQKMAYEALLGRDEQLISDFTYLLHEVSMMKDGGSITVDGKLYQIRNLTDLLHYWTETEAFDNG